MRGMTGAVDGVLVQYFDCDGCVTPSDPEGEWYDQTLWVGAQDFRESPTIRPPPSVNVHCVSVASVAVVLFASSPTRGVAVGMRTAHACA